VLHTVSVICAEPIHAVSDYVSSFDVDVLFLLTFLQITTTLDNKQSSHRWTGDRLVECGHAAMMARHPGACSSRFCHPVPIQ
jgi:hypothetical protein